MKRSIENKVPVFCLIRARGGDFNYSSAEVDVMVEDITALASAGADGFVIGALTLDGSVDEAACASLVAAAPPNTPFTFHRAFDMAADPAAALRAVGRLGCTRLLTSGQRKTAAEGSSLLRTLVSTAPEGVSIMAGGGVDEDNLRALLMETGVKEFHASARVTLQSEMRFRNPHCSMGTDSREYDIKVTSEERVKRMVAIFNEVTEGQRSS